MEISPLQNKATLIMNKNRANEMLEQKIKIDSKADSKSDFKKNPLKQKDMYIPSEVANEKITYDKATPKIDYAAIEKLKIENDENLNSLKEKVVDLFKKQAIISENSKDTDTTVDIYEEIRIAAKESIGERSLYTPERISSRIVAFAKALSGLDTSKFEAIKSVVTKGFEGAAITMGGDLPEISHETYRLIMERLNKWV